MNNVSTFLRYNWPFFPGQSSSDLFTNRSWHALPYQYAIYPSGFSGKKLPRFQGFSCQNIRLWTLKGPVRIWLLHGRYIVSLLGSIIMGWFFFDTDGWAPDAANSLDGSRDNPVLLDANCWQVFCRFRHLGFWCGPLGNFHIRPEALLPTY